MASGDTLGIFTPQRAEPPATLYGILTTRNGILLLDFDPTTAWASIFRSVLPKNYAGGGLTIDIYWMAATATSGDVVWGIAIERDNEGNHDLDADAFATQQTATGTANAASGKLTKTTVTVSSGANMDSLAAGEPYRMQVQRVAASGSDTMTGNAEIHSIHAKET
jgi:hypothetical protein